MQTNKEFSAQNHISDLSAEMAEMALFTIDMGDTLVCSGRDENGKRKMKRANPHLRGKSADLWEITPIRTTMTLAEMKAAEKVAKQTEADKIRAANVVKYAAMVAGGCEDREESLFPDSQVELTEDERFFGLDTELVGGKCRRRGGIKNHQGFEDFADSAQ